MTFANITREPADDWIGTGIAETVSSDLKNIHGLTVIGRARVYDALRNLSTNAHLNDSLAIDIGRRLGATWVVVGGFQRIGELVRITANFVDVATGAVRRTVKVDGRIDDIFALQDKIVYELSQGLNVALRGTEVAEIERQETRSVEAYESYARGMMNLRQATRDSIDRAIAAFEDATRHDPEYAIAWAALGGAYGLKGAFLSMPDLLDKAIEIERRALAIDPELADAHMWLGAALLSLGTHRRGDRRDPRGDPPRAGQRPGAPGAGARLLGRQGGLRRGDPGVRARDRAESRGRLLVPAARRCCSPGKGSTSAPRKICRRAVELQEQYISGNAGLQIVGAHARLGYVYYLQGRYDEALREYEREMAFIGSSDHALRERTAIELNVKIGAAYHRQGRPDEADAAFRSRAARRSTRVSRKGADDPFTRYYIACLLALRGDADRAFDSLERVAAMLPALTAARARRDPDLDVAARRSALRRDCAQVSFAPVATMYDVVIVGGGPAGLSAALMLGRCRRSVLVCDNGTPRNDASHAMHGYLTRDGMPPAEFLRLAREELEQYDTVELRDVEVDRRRVPVRRPVRRHARDGRRQSRSRKLLIATGVVDNVPDDRGLPRAVRPQRVPLPVLRRLGGARPAAGDLRPRRARLRPVARADRLEPRSRAVHRRPVRRSTRTSLERLARNGIAVREERVARLEGNGDGVLQRDRVRDGEPLAAARAVLHHRPVPAVGSARCAWAASSTTRAPSAPASTRPRTSPACSSPATRHAPCSGSWSPRPKAPKRPSRSTPT